jgi:2-isopropylmalate synthase
METTIYRLQSYSVSNGWRDGERISATADISFINGAEIVSARSDGNGPIEAAFNAVSKAIGREFELKEFQITAITEGADASGEANIKLHSSAETFSGAGRSRDILGAAILAYISAVNKIILKEAEQ